MNNRHHRHCDLGAVFYAAILECGISGDLGDCGVGKTPQLCTETNPCNVGIFSIRRENSRRQKGSVQLGH